MIIQRPDELAEIKNSNKWVLVYCRGKTGKTFLVDRLMECDEYFFVKRDKGHNLKGRGPPDDIRGFHRGS